MVESFLSAFARLRFLRGAHRKGRHGLYLRAQRVASYSKARFAETRKLTRNMVRQQCFLLPNDKKNARSAPLIQKRKAIAWGRIRQAVCYGLAQGEFIPKLTRNMLGMNSPYGYSSFPR